MRVAVATVALFASSALLAANGPSTPKATGWRGDWTGRYPDATPVTEWSYAPRSTVTGLRYLAAKPKDGDNGRGAKLVWGGDVAAWLALGPFKAKDAKTALDEPFLPDEAALAPAEGDKVDELAWTPMGEPDYREAFTPKNIHRHRYGPYALGGNAMRTYELPGQGANLVGYAHSWLHAESAGKVCFLVNHEDGMRFWVNGKEVYRNEQRFRNFYFYEDDVAIRDLTVPQPCPRFDVELRKGWNRVLVKLFCKQRSGAFSLRIAAPADAEYQATNIRWVTRMPSWSWAMPIIVGDRIFTTSEPADLVCVDKRDGKILWQRTNTIYDAISAEDRAKHPLFKEVEPIAAELAQGVAPERCTTLLRQMTGILTKIDKEKYSWTNYGHASAMGHATPSPVSDGQFVYALFSPGVVVCYDLEGNRRWIQNVLDLGIAPAKDGTPHNPTPNTSSPALVGDKLILFKGWFRAFDKRSGKVAWDTGNLAKDFDSSHGDIPRYFSSSSLVPFTLDGQGFVMGYWGRILRAADGRVMADPVLTEHIYNTPVVDGDVAYVWGNQKYRMTLEGDHVARKGLGLIEGMQQWTVSSPLLHDGLIYAMDSHGEVIVVDAQTLRTVYRQRLDMWPLFHFNAIGATPSVALGGKHVFLMDNQGTAVVIEPGRTFKQVGYNCLRASIQHPWPLTTLERTQSAPIFEGKWIYIRGERNLYCIGEK
jgi:outer membrane protein assembly factor BamB